MLLGVAESSRFACAMEEMTALGITFCLVFLHLPSLSEAREFCQAGQYWCDTGHCCGNGECCTYYYELWWFWLVWFLIVFIIGFCVWQRKKLHPWRGNANHRTCSVQDFLRGFNFENITPVPPCKLPSYSEIGDTVGYDTPPPPYTYYYIQAATSGFGNANSSDCQTCGNNSGLSALTPRLTEVAIETQGNEGGESRLETPDSTEAPPSYAQIMETSREREMRAVAKALAQTLTPSRSPTVTPGVTPVVSPPVTPLPATPRPTPSATPAATPRPTPCGTPAMTPAVTRSPRASPAGTPQRASPAATPSTPRHELAAASSQASPAATAPTPAPVPAPAPTPASPEHLTASGNASASSDRGVTSTIVDLQINDRGSLNYVTRLT